MLPKIGKGRQTIWKVDHVVNLEDLTFVIPIIISVVILIVFLLRKYYRWTVPCTSSNRLEGKTVVITGANTGIGRATATELSRRGGRVIIACRDRCKGEAVALQIRSKTRNPDVYCYELDLASLSSIKEFVNEFNNREPVLHVLINNAAYMGPKATTVDGYEKSLGVNYLGHFYLTYLLQDKLKRGAPSRIINLISDTYSKATFNFEDLALTKYDIMTAYARSKLAMVMFTMELHRRWSAEIVHSYGVHPGWVSSDLQRSWPGISGNVLRACSRILFKSPEDGCQTVVFCAVAEKLRELSGKCFENCNIFKLRNSAKDHETCEKLWNVSMHLCGLESEIPETAHAETKPEPENKVQKVQVQNIGPVKMEPETKKGK
ncbi:retinol dehydrogenase 12-like isoform X2 [Dreissena polymorpha]|nr:retinol dehydrogenase 12-like isoform X2 [Dreissena polymorpha]